jgi:hypothetical protein
VYVALQEKQVRGSITFEEACDDLHNRCEAIRADELLSTPVRGNQKGLLFTENKRRNKLTGKDKAEVEQAPCLEKSCTDLVKKYLPLCGLHYHQCVSGKCAEVELKSGYGVAKFNSKTQAIDYPPSVPKDRLPTPASERPRKALTAVTFRVPDTGVLPEVSLVPLVPSRDSSVNGGDGDWDEMAPESLDQRPAVRVLASKTSSTTVVFYVDSGAGQCLSSCSTAFRSLDPCQLEVVGVAGSLPIFGIGTAIFALVLAGGSEVLVRVHNCLYSFGEFNLLSVSQMQTNHMTSIELSLEAPSIRLYSADRSVKRGQGLKRGQDFIDVPLEMDEGLYALVLEPVSSDDTRYLSSRIFDLTPPGDYSPVSQKADVGCGQYRSSRQSHQWGGLWHWLGL